MSERNGVRVGQRVRDAGGRDLGKVTDLYDWGFAVARGFLLFRRDWVARYDEVRGVRDGSLVIARSDGDLDALAQGGIAPSWRIPAPPHFPATATPAEAQGVLEEIASGAITAAPPEPFGPYEGEGWPPEPPAAAPPAPRDPAPSPQAPDVRRYSDSRGPSLAQVPAPPAVK